MSTEKNAQSTSVIIGPARFSYLNALRAKPTPGGKEKYSVSLLIPKTDKELKKKINTAVEAAITAGLSKWGGKKPAKLKLPLRDGDAEENEPEKHPERKGHYFINATSDQKPGWVDALRNKMLNPSEEEVYSGMYGRASVNFYAFDTNGNKGIGCGLMNLQKLREGEKFSSRIDAEDDFNDDYVFEAESKDDLD